MYSSKVDYLGATKEDADYIYYNIDIINNRLSDLTAGQYVPDPIIRFNETRDTYLVKDASKYHFSIVRFSMDGPNRNLPLFIPEIVEGQTDVNKTAYTVAIPYKQTWDTSLGKITFSIIPQPTSIAYVPETLNTTLAPIPQPPIVQYPQWLPTTNYAAYTKVNWLGVDYIASTAAGNINQQPNLSPAFWTATPFTPAAQDISTRYYWVYTYEHFIGLVNSALTNNWFQVYLDFQTAWANAGLNATGVDPFPFPTFDDFVAYIPAPSVTYDADTNRFSWYAPTIAFGQPLQPFISQIYRPAAAYNPLVAYNQGDLVIFNGVTYVSQVGPNLGNLPISTYNATVPYGVGAGNTVVYQNIQYASTAAFPGGAGYTPPNYPPYWTRITPAVAPFLPPYWIETTQVGAFGPPICTLFLNTNLYNLFAGMEANYYNTLTNPTYGPVPAGYVWEVKFNNDFYTNIYDLTNNTNVPEAQRKTYWVAKQDIKSTDSLWSPIASLVFITTLLPIRAEQVGPPIILNESNATSDSYPTVQSAFQPIITDIAVDTSSSANGAGGYKEFLYYVPSAEYRLGDFGPSKQEIRNIDIQVFWKCRLNNELYPITIPNSGTVHLKLMFRHRDVYGKSGRD